MHGHGGMHGGGVASSRWYGSSSNSGEVSIDQRPTARARATSNDYGTDREGSSACANQPGHGELKLGGGNGGSGDRRAPGTPTLAQMAL